MLKQHTLIYTLLCQRLPFLSPASDMTCVVLFGACIEGVLLRDK